jgi:hypothetical protein
MSEGAGDPNPAAVAPYLAPFVLQIGTDCRFRELQFLPDASTESRQKIERLVRSMEVILSPLPVVQWVSQHQDEIGTSQVSYVADKRRPEALLDMQRLRYSSTTLPWLPQFGGRLEIGILESRGQAKLDADGRWLRELNSEERLRVAVGARQFSETATRLQLMRIDAGEEPPPGFAKLDIGQFVSARVAKAAVSTDPRAVADADPTLRAMDLSGALGDFATQLTQTKDGLFRASERLASYLAANPKAIDDLLSRIRSGSVPANLHSALFLALERTGTVAAEKGLSAALADHGMDTTNRMRAAAALQDIPKPGENTARALVEQARASGGEEQRVANAALLALGALSHRMLTKQPDLARIARDEIGRRLAAGRGPEQVDVALDAVGNSGDKELADLVKPFMKNASSDIRAHAAQAFRRMPLDTMEPVLSDWLDSEPESAVRRSISSALTEGLFTENHTASSPTIAAVIKRLPTEPDPKVRASLIALLGPAASTDPAAKQALVDQFAREPLAGLKVLIGRYVSADDLH